MDYKLHNFFLAEKEDTFLTRLENSSRFYLKSLFGSNIAKSLHIKLIPPNVPYIVLYIKCNYNLIFSLFFTSTMNMLANRAPEIQDLLCFWNSAQPEKKRFIKW